MKTIILCGGRGTRAYPHTEEIPKPLLPVGDRPILRHLMEVHTRQGLSQFVLAGGYRCEQLERFATTLPPAWSVEVVDTGPDTGTAERLRRCLEHVGDPFLATYGDGLAAIDLAELMQFHDSHEGAATVTVVPLPSPYGTIDRDERGLVRGFVEKPVLPDRLINAGFFVFDRRALEHRTDGDDLERQVLPGLAAANELYAYQHEGFWRSMDTYKDALELSALCSEGDPPWLASPRSPRSPSARSHA